MHETLTDLPATHTRRLLLRPLDLADAAALQQMTDDPAITEVVDILPDRFAIADAERLILGAQDGRDCFLGAFHRETGRLEAVVGVHLRREREVEIGYWVRRDLHGQGLATEAASGALAVLERRLAGWRVVAECRPENLASWRVLEKLGFRGTSAAGARPGRRRLALTRGNLEETWRTGP